MRFIRMINWGPVAQDLIGLGAVSKGWRVKVSHFAAKIPKNLQFHHVLRITSYHMFIPTLEPQAWQNIIPL